MTLQFFKQSVWVKIKLCIHNFAKMYQCSVLLYYIVATTALPGWVIDFDQLQDFYGIPSRFLPFIQFVIFFLYQLLGDYLLALLLDQVTHITPSTVTGF